MASFNKHQEQAEHNLKIANSLGNGEFRDWTITTCFYSALHFTNLLFLRNPAIGHIDELFNKQRFSTDTAEDIKKTSIHAFRESIIGSQYRSILRQYRQLRTMSEAVRYLEDTGDKSGIEYIDSKVADSALSDLSTIKTEVDKLLETTK